MIKTKLFKTGKEKINPFLKEEKMYMKFNIFIFSIKDLANNFQKLDII